VTEAHTAVDSLGFMKKVVRAYPKQELHVILDNSSTHGTPDVVAWLAEHPEVHADQRFVAQPFATLAAIMGLVVASHGSF
jgi:hypothetical protein